MSICAVIVTFHPVGDISRNIAALRDQVDEIIIVDNGSGAGCKELLEALAQQPGVRIVYCQENLGIAAALNIGVKLARAAGHQWIATFDQDSKVTPGMINAMLSAYDACPDRDKVASLAPRYMDKSTGKIRGNNAGSPSHGDLPYEETLVVMTSGNLLKSSIFDAVGYFKESLFIDHVDNEFCLRCADHGYKILEVKDAALEHCIGYPTQHKFLWKNPVTSNHSALRRYYLARNSVYIYRKYFFTHPGWVLKNAYVLLRVVVLMLLLETDRGQKIGMMFRGFLHGLYGRMGKLEKQD